MCVQCCTVTPCAALLELACCHPSGRDCSPRRRALRPLSSLAPCPTLLQVCLPAAQQPGGRCPCLLSTQHVRSLCGFSPGALRGHHLCAAAQHSNLLVPYMHRAVRSSRLLVLEHFLELFLPKTMSQPMAVTPCHWQLCGADSQGPHPRASRDTPQVPLRCGVPSQDWRLLRCVGSHLLLLHLQSGLFPPVGYHAANIRVQAAGCTRVLVFLGCALVKDS